MCMSDKERPDVVGDEIRVIHVGSFIPFPSNFRGKIKFKILKVLLLFKISNSPKWC